MMLPNGHYRFSYAVTNYAFPEIPTINRFPPDAWISIISVQKTGILLPLHKTQPQGATIYHSNPVPTEKNTVGH